MASKAEIELKVQYRPSRRLPRLAWFFSIQKVMFWKMTAAFRPTRAAILGSKLWRLMIGPLIAQRRANVVQVLHEKSATSAKFGVKALGTFCTLLRKEL
ncbi:hypothetical protein [Roseovarius amoyensis]|uniref:hypothetical protein n=1 Tax=Roseovarius amoyensis TaxID=2211448 RepID=UPI00195514EB|nr:hypothetical protein [Roseovarius amoyensis]